MEILTDFDGLQEAMKKINLDESVMPYVNGRLVDSDAYNKTQKILNCPEMISAHKFLYNLDMDQLTEEEVQKINSLYKLGCDRGFITDDLTNWDEENKPAETPEQATTEVKPEIKSVSGTLFKAKIPCWTVIYSATKDGDIKTGEAYSNAISRDAAKADVNAKLSRIGYQNITILAIEATDDCVGEVKIDTNVEENDMLNNRPHNNHVSEADKSDENETNDADENKDAEDESTDDEDESADEETSKETEDEDTESTDDENAESTDEDASDEKEDSKESTDKQSTNDDKESENDEEDELDANKKAELRDQYRRVFKNVLSKCKFTTSFNDLTLEEKVKFFTELSKAWKKNEPNEFMTDKEIEQLNNVVVKEEPESDDDEGDDEDKE